MHTLSKSILALIILGILQITFSHPLTQHTSTYATLEQGNIEYDKYGDSSQNTIVLIHGSPGSKDGLTLLAKSLADDYTVYVPSMYCFGHSSMVDDCGIDNAADSLKEFLDKMNITDATILGESWGSGVAIEYAYKYPANTDNLILLSGMGIQEGEPFGTYAGDKTWQYLVYPFFVYYPGVFYKSQNYREGTVRSFLDSDQRPIVEHLQQIKTPTLVLHSKTDRVVPFWVAEKHAQLLQNAKLETFTGSHGEFHTNVVEIAPKILEFLKEENSHGK